MWETPAVCRERCTPGSRIAIHRLPIGGDASKVAKKVLASWLRKGYHVGDVEIRFRHRTLRRQLTWLVLLPLPSPSSGARFAATAACQEDNKPPEGFMALFNGTDLSGWYGLGHFDPRSCRR